MYRDFIQKCVQVIFVPKSNNNFKRGDPPMYTFTLKKTCTFSLPLSFIWDVFTNPETLSLWLSPRPYSIISYHSDFREGGHWLYYLLSQQGEKYWNIAQYKKIEINKLYEVIDAVCDENGVINDNFHQLRWQYSFGEEEGKTNVHMFLSVACEEKMQPLFKRGFEGAYQMEMVRLHEFITRNILCYKSLYFTY